MIFCDNDQLQRETKNTPVPVLRNIVKKRYPLESDFLPNFKKIKRATLRGTEN